MRKRTRKVNWYNYELLFDVDGNPSVRNKKTNKVLSTYSIGSGGRYLALGVEGNNVLLHRAVWFLNEIANGRELPDYYVEIHHKDGNTRNNKIENLEALTMEEHLRQHKNLGVSLKWRTDEAWRNKMLSILAQNRKNMKRQQQNKQTEE